MKAKKKAAKKVAAKKTKKAPKATKAKKTTKKAKTEKTEKTHILAIVDKSSSMLTVRDAAINGFNKFLQDQKKLKVETTMNVVLFSSHDQITDLYSGEFLPINDVKELTTETYVPNGWTALNDAIVSSMTKVKLRTDALKPSKRPDKILVIIVTDGQENDSKEYPKSKVDEVKCLITKRKTENWQFMFLCSTEDAAFTGEVLGVSKGNVLKYTNDVAGNNEMYSKMSFAASSYRTTSTKSRGFSKLSNNLLAEDDVQETKPSLPDDLDDQNL